MSEQARYKCIKERRSVSKPNQSISMQTNAINPNQCSPINAFHSIPFNSIQTTAILPLSASGFDLGKFPQVGGSDADSGSIALSNFRIHLSLRAGIDLGKFFPDRDRWFQRRLRGIVVSFIQASIWENRPRPRSCPTSFDTRVHRLLVHPSKE